VAQFHTSFESLNDRLRRAGVHSRGTRLSKASRLSLAQTTLCVQDKAYVALQRYWPRAYSGKIRFVKSESDSFFRVIRYQSGLIWQLPSKSRPCLEAI
jgi:hypothetical protein